MFVAPFARLGQREGTMSLDVTQGWVPAAVAWEGGRATVTLAQFGRRRPRAPFLIQDLSSELPIARVPIDALTGPGGPSTFRVAGSVFHMSRCGSTLVSQMFASLDHVVTLSEPVALNDVLLVPAEVGTSERQAVLRQLLDVFARALCRSGQALVIKWSSWTVLHLGLIGRALPETPSVFLHRDPLEVLVSLSERPPGWASCLPITDLMLRAAGRAAGPTSPRDPTFLAGCLAGLCAAAHAARLLMVDYAELPGATWRKIASHFGIQLDGEQLAAMQAVSRLNAHDLGRIRSFVPDSASKQDRASPAIRQAATEVLAPFTGRLREGILPATG